MRRHLSRRIFRQFTQVALAFAVLAGVMATGGLAVADQGINKTFWGDVAIDGYDPVAYFTKATATQGSEEFSYSWAGANWHFSSAEHRDLFMADPAKYAPQYGGFCALSASVGKTRGVDPQAWTIWHGKLYLNYDRETNDRFAARASEHVENANSKTR